MRKIYKYKILLDLDNLELYISEQEGYFVRNQSSNINVYSETSDGKNLFFVYTTDIDKVNVYYYSDNYDNKGSYDIYGYTEYEDGEEYKKQEIQNKVKEKLKEISETELNRILNFLKRYEEIIK